MMMMILIMAMTMRPIINTMMMLMTTTMMRITIRAVARVLKTGVRPNISRGVVGEVPLIRGG